MHELLITGVATAATSVKKMLPFSTSFMATLSLLVIYSATKKRRTYLSKQLHSLKKQKKPSFEQNMAIIFVIIGVTLILGFFVSWGLGLIAGLVILLAFLNGLSKGR